VPNFPPAQSSLLIYWCTLWYTDTTTSLCLLLCNDSAKCHIIWCGEPGVETMTAEFKLGRDFCTEHLGAKFHHPTFNHLQVIVLKNRQTNKRCWKHPPRFTMLIKEKVMQAEHAERTKIAIIFHNCLHLVTWRTTMLRHAHTQSFYSSVDFVLDNPGELVPEVHYSIFWIFWCKMKLTQTDTQTIRMDCHPIQTKRCPHLCHPTNFYARRPSWHNPTNLSWHVTGTKYAGLHTRWLAKTYAMKY